MGDLFSGDERAAPTQESTANILQAYIANLPALLQTTNAQIAPTEQALFASRQGISPQEQQLNYDLYRRFSPQYAETAAQTERNLIQGTGGEAARASQALQEDLLRSNEALQRELNPEYYRNRSAAGLSLAQLLSGQNPNELTGAEMTNVERGLNRLNEGRGIQNVPSNASAITNALTFGNALEQKRANVSQAINSATNFLGTNRPAAPTSFDPFAQATGRTGTANFGTSYSGGNPGQQSVFGTGGQLLNTAGGLQQNKQSIDANRRSITDYVNQAYSSATGPCCFIFLEVLNGNLPWWIRKLRDQYYKEEFSVREGYIKMSKWLVPLMKRFNWMKYLVNTIMVQPMIKYGGYLENVEGYSKYGKYKIVKKFWFSIWRNL